MLGECSDCIFTAVFDVTLTQAPLQSVLSQVSGNDCVSKIQGKDSEKNQDPQHPIKLKWMHVQKQRRNKTEKSTPSGVQVQPPFLGPAADSSGVDSVPQPLWCWRRVSSCCLEVRRGDPWGAKARTRIEGPLSSRCPQSLAVSASWSLLFSLLVKVKCGHGEESDDTERHPLQAQSEETT